MGKFFLIVTIVILVLAGTFYYLDSNTTRRSGKTILTKGTINFGTQEFANGMLIPLKFTCDGKNVNPTFYIERTPDLAKSLVLVMEDLDTSPDPFVHWIVFNIPPQTTLIEEGRVPAGAVVATNDFGETEYLGPCPSIGTHRYFFRIYALDSVLDLTKGADINDINKAIKGRIITTGETFGEYTK
jgi:Raf kinase inhibitor-like YbhB/YbcL family protein